MKNKKYSSSAFTLSEVLITLSIIGIIASITIPTLLQDKKEQELKTTYKKMYSTLSQATIKLAADSGGTLKGDKDFANRFSKYLNVARICTALQAQGNCWHKTGEYKYLNGSPAPAHGSEASMVLNDGSFIFFGNRSETCTTTLYDVPDCAIIWIDTNGFKKPNMYGKDIFKIHLMETGIKPIGIPEDSINPKTDCSATGTGSACGYKILTEQ